VSASVSTRSIVPPGSFAFAAASTLAAVSPVSSFSVLPSARWPPSDGPRLGGACWVCAAVLDEEDVVVPELAALAIAEPASAAAPIAAIAVSLLRMEGIGVLLCSMVVCCGDHRAAAACEAAQSWLGMC
jgi:hypothetical protein